MIAMLHYHKDRRGQFNSQFTLKTAVERTLLIRLLAKPGKTQRRRERRAEKTGFLGVPQRPLRLCVYFGADVDWLLKAPFFENG
jgi:hypothetical protein